MGGPDTERIKQRFSRAPLLVGQNTLPACLSRTCALFYDCKRVEIGNVNRCERNTSAKIEVNFWVGLQRLRQRVRHIRNLHEDLDCFRLASFAALFYSDPTVCLRGELQPQGLTLALQFACEIGRASC